MIEQYFAAPVQNKFDGKPWPVYQIGHRPQQQQHPVTSKEEDRAAKRGLSTTEYRARVALVSKLQSECPFQIGDTVWPYYAKDYRRLGKCIITGVCRHYDDYGDVEWNDPPFLLAVSPLKERTQSIQCSVGWVTKEAPALLEVPADEC